MNVARALAIFWLSAGLHAAAAAAAQQPRRDDRQIVPTPGVTTVGSPRGIGRTQPQAGARAAGIGRGPGPGHATAARPDAAPDGDGSDPRTPATWALFGALVIALGLMTIRMLRRPGFRPDALLDASATDELPLDSRA